MPARSFLKKKAKKPKIRTFKYVIDCQITVEDNIISLDSFVKYLTENVKNEGKKNNLGDRIAINKEGYNAVVTVKGKFPKRYLKYLSKKYLKKQGIRDYIRVLASGKTSYQLRYFKVNSNDDEEGDE